MGVSIELKNADGTACDGARSASAVQYNDEGIEKWHVQHGDEEIHDNSQGPDNNALNWLLSFESHERIQEPQAKDEN